MKALIALLILAACAQSQTTPKFWRKHRKVCVAIDGAQMMLNVRNAAASGEPVITTDLPPSYKLMEGKLIVWPEEEDVPGGTSYQYMTPGQALRAAYNIDGPGGLCVAEGNRCDSWLSAQDVNALKDELAKDGLPDELFNLMRRPR